MFTRPIADDAELRPLEPWQAAEFAAHVDKARPNIGPYIPWADLISDEQSARDFLQRYADRQAADGGRIYGIWLADELVGGVLFRIFDAGAGNCEIGVWLAADAEGRGLVTRAAQQLIDWAVGVRGLSRVEWRCVPSNKRSVAVAERLGLTCEGTLRKAFPYRDEIHDIQIWSMLDHEWQDRSWR